MSFVFVIYGLNRCDIWISLNMLFKSILVVVSGLKLVKQFTDGFYLSRLYADSFLSFCCLIVSCKGFLTILSSMLVGR